MSYIENVKETIGNVPVFVGNETTEFSWSSCESCGSQLGGSRHEAFTIDPTTKEVGELSICTDCLMFHANGDLPEGEE
jgi:hypothetical protein